VPEALTRKRNRRAKALDPRERELKRLKLSVCDDTGFRLLLATYDQRRQRDELIARVVKEAEVEKVRVTRLDLGDTGPETNLVGLLRSHLAQIDFPHGWRQAVMVTGIEYRIIYVSERDGLAFLHQANLLRDALPEVAPMPVVLWLSRIASALLPIEAPDLWHWRAASFDFTSDKIPRLELLRELTAQPLEGSDRLTGKQRRARIEMLGELLEELEREGPPKSKRQAAERAAVLLDLGGEQRKLGLAAEAIPRLERALEVSRQIGDRQGEANALRNLGFAHMDLHESQQAIDFYKQALVVAREVGDRTLQGQVRSGLGDAFRDLGEPQRAIEHYEEALRIGREVGNRAMESETLSRISRVYLDLREARHVIEHCQQAVEIAREIGDQWLSFRPLMYLGAAFYDVDEPKQAFDYWREALAILCGVGARDTEGWTLAQEVRAYRDLGEPNLAIEVLQQALVIAEAIGAKELAEWARAELVELDVNSLKR
jgi:tetratricopeptide (TPR) repeat protein